MSRERDLAWETLVRETYANPAIERGQLNVALKAIREAAFSEGLMEEGLPDEIRFRAACYRDVFPNIALTPLALAKHWHRVLASRNTEPPRSPQQKAMDDLRGRS